MSSCPCAIAPTTRTGEGDQERLSKWAGNRTVSSALLDSPSRVAPTGRCFVTGPFMTYATSAAVSSSSGSRLQKPNSKTGYACATVRLSRSGAIAIVQMPDSCTMSNSASRHNDVSRASCAESRMPIKGIMIPIHMRCLSILVHLLMQQWSSTVGRSPTEGMQMQSG